MGDGNGVTGIVIPAGVLETIEAQAPQPETPAAGGGAQIISSALPGGVSAAPIDAATFLTVAFPPCYNPQFSARTVNATLNARILQPDGTLNYCAYPLSFALGSGLNFQALMAPGYLLSVAVTCQTAAIPSGVLFCAAGLTHQSGSTLPFDTLLLSSYVSTAAPAGWPSGVLQDISSGAGAQFAANGSAPAAGAAAQYVFNTTYFQLTAANCTLTTDAVVANRYVKVLAIQAVGPAALLGVASVAQTAGAAVTYYAVPGGAAGVIFGSGAQIIPIPAGVFIGMSANITFQAVGMDPGDQFSAVGVNGRAWL